MAAVQVGAAVELLSLFWGYWTTIVPVSSAGDEINL